MQLNQPVIHAPSTSPSSAEYLRAVQLSKRLWSSKIATTVSPTGDLMLDMTGYKSNDDRILQAEVVARKILSEEIEGNVDIGSLIGADDKGNIWIYGSESAKEAADRKISSGAGSLRALNPVALRSQDAMSDPGYHSDDNQSDGETIVRKSSGVSRRDSDSAVGLSAPGSPEGRGLRRESSLPMDTEDPMVRNFAKTLRLTHDQLKSLNLQPGANTMSFAVGKAACQGSIYYWKSDVPIVISDIDGTITKSDALGHVLTIIGRDWTHMGVAKLYTDIVANGYHILYLTSRSVGQADMTRGYLNGVQQDGYKLPSGPVIMSPDRTMAALRREVYLRKPEVFKMACLRDVAALFQTSLAAAVPEPASPTSITGHAADTTFFHQRTPFYAGFGNRLTDALSYRSVGIPPTRIFTINSNAEVSLHLLTLNAFRTSYMSIWELVDHYFPPVGLLVQEGGEGYTDFNYWREPTLEVDQFSGSESDSEEERERERMRFREEYDEEEEYDDEEGEYEEDMEGSFMSRDSLDGASYMSRDSMDGELEGDDLVRESGVLEPVVEEDEGPQEYEDDVLLEDAVLEDEPSRVEEPDIQATEGAALDEVTQKEDASILEEATHNPEVSEINGSASQPPEETHSVKHEIETKEDHDIMVSESLPIQALNLEADEEVVHLPDLDRASSLPEQDSPRK
jgi:phosphatidate phosphatase LPIN